MRIRITTWLIILGLIGMASGLAAKAPPKQISIDKSKSKQPAVTFNHEEHAKTLKIGCKTCHHKGKTEQGCESSGCHEGKAKDKTPGAQEASPTKNPFHIRCIGCHKEKGKGPKACKECHKK
jgi:hypothetical protein